MGARKTTKEWMIEIEMRTAEQMLAQWDAEQARRAEAEAGHAAWLSELGYEAVLDDPEDVAGGVAVSYRSLQDIADENDWDEVAEMAERRAL
jgi:hypothetical protein